MTEQLTPREVEIARLVAAGRSTKGIATDLRISVRTVEVHIANAARKLGGTGSPKLRLVVFVVELLREEHRAKASA